jgi:DNA-binding transcriptional MerR regulator
MSELLTAAELATRLRVKPTTIRDWEREGVIPSIRINSKVIRYSAEAVIRALSDRQEVAR